jgi:pentatricopeptide repeat protein
MASFYGQSVLLGARLSRLDRRGAKPLHSLPNFRQVYNTLIAALRQIGQTDEARTVMAERIERFGAVSDSTWRCL